MLRGESLGGEAFDSASRLGKLTQVRGTNTGAGRTDVARLAACHRFRKGEGVTRQKRKEVEASVRARIEELGFGCPHVVVQLQKSIGDVRPRISSANALQKERSGSSEQGPSSECRSAAKPSTAPRVKRRIVPRPHREDGRGPAQTQGDERSSSSGFHIAKSGGEVVGPGL
jgi:hypothetical protein